MHVTKRTRRLKRDENAGKKNEPKVRAQKMLRDCISVIMWASRPGCGFLINFANFSINARRSFREKGRWKKGGGSDATTTMASRKEGLPVLQSPDIVDATCPSSPLYSNKYEPVNFQSPEPHSRLYLASHAIMDVDTPNGAWYPKYVPCEQDVWHN